MLGSARLEAVDDVVLALAQREREVRAHADRHAEAGAARDGMLGADGDHLRVQAAVERTPSGQEVGGSARRRDDGDRVAEGAQRFRDAGDVLVDLVRLRPGERRDEADAEATRRV